MFFDNRRGSSYRFVSQYLFPALLLAAGILFIPENILAQPAVTLEHKEWEATIFAGGSFLNSRSYETPIENSSPEASRSVGLRFASGAKLGARVTDNHWQHLGASLEYSYSNQPVTFTNLSDAIPSLSLGHAIHRVAYDIIYYTHDRGSRLRPYVFAGPGVSLFYIRGDSKDAAQSRGLDLKDSWKISMNWGGGVKYLIKRKIAASFQFGDSVSGVPGYGLPKKAGMASGIYAPGFRPDGLLNNWLIEAGLNLQWNAY